MRKDSLKPLFRDSLSGKPKPVLIMFEVPTTGTEAIFLAKTPYYLRKFCLQLLWEMYHNSKKKDPIRNPSLGVKEALRTKDGSKAFDLLLKIGHPIIGAEVVPTLDEDILLNLRKIDLTSDHHWPGQTIDLTK